MAFNINQMTTTEVRETLERVERRERQRRSQHRHTSERRHLERMLAEVLEPQTVPELATILRAPAQVPEHGFNGSRWIGEYGDAWGDAR